MVRQDFVHGTSHNVQNENNSREPVETKILPGNVTALS